MGDTRYFQFNMILSNLPSILSIIMVPFQYQYSVKVKHQYRINVDVHTDTHTYTYYTYTYYTYTYYTYIQTNYSKIVQAQKHINMSISMSNGGNLRGRSILTTVTTVSPPLSPPDAIVQNKKKWSAIFPILHEFDWPHVESECTMLKFREMVGNWPVASCCFSL